MNKISFFKLKTEFIPVVGIFNFNISVWNVWLCVLNPMSTVRNNIFSLWLKITGAIITSSKYTVICCTLLHDVHKSPKHVVYNRLKNM